MEYYFDIIEWKELGGGIAYQILWNNLGQLDHLDIDEEAAEVVHYLVSLDQEYTRTGKVPNLFAFFIARPKKRGLGPVGAYQRYLWEPFREKFSTSLYRDLYPRDTFRLLKHGGRKLLGGRNGHGNNGSG